MIYNPTLKELKIFAKEDDTDKREYKNDTFVCTEFTNTFVKNFAEKGYFSCITILTFENKNIGHAIVAINTSDYGLVYVEPQSYKIIYSLEVGDNYCKKVNWNCNFIIKKISNCFEIKVKS